MLNRGTFAKNYYENSLGKCEKYYFVLRKATLLCKEDRSEHAEVVITLVLRE